jgi:hypothetical protein
MSSLCSREGSHAENTEGAKAQGSLSGTKAVLTAWKRSGLWHLPAMISILSAVPVRAQELV